MIIKKKNLIKAYQNQWHVYILSAVYTEWEAVGVCQVPLWCNGAPDTVVWDGKVQQPVVHHWCSSALSGGERPWSSIIETVKNGRVWYFTQLNDTNNRGHSLVSRIVKCIRLNNPCRSEDNSVMIIVAIKNILAKLTWGKKNKNKASRTWKEALCYLTKGWFKQLCLYGHIVCKVEQAKGRPFLISW